MAAGKKKASRRRKKKPTVRVATVERVERSTPPDFMPPNVEQWGEQQAERSTYSEPVATYFLTCDKRGIAPLLPAAHESYVRAFRGVLLAPPGLDVSAFRHVELVGLKQGDHFALGRRWVDSNVLVELEAEH